MPSSLPTAIKRYVSLIPYPVALIGCRTSQKSLDCCEYDLAVFAQESKNNNNQVLSLAEHKTTTVEIIYLEGPVHHHILELNGMVVLKDTEKFMLSSAAKDMSPEKYHKILYAAGKKSMVSSLFYQQRMRDEAKNPIAAAMWLKMAAYEFVAGLLALYGIRPMPLHELEQLRQLQAGTVMAEGIHFALECIGTERATRPAISRSLEAVQELKSKDYDRELVMSKIRHLVGKRMLANCYYYAGKVAAKSLTSKNLFFYNRYSKLIQLALDLSSDTPHLDRLQKGLFRAANSGLKG